MDRSALPPARKPGAAPPDGHVPPRQPAHREHTTWELRTAFGALVEGGVLSSHDVRVAHGITDLLGDNAYPAFCRARGVEHHLLRNSRFALKPPAQTGRLRSISLQPTHGLWTGADRSGSAPGALDPIPGAKGFKLRDLGDRQQARADATGGRNLALGTETVAFLPTGSRNQPGDAARMRKWKVVRRALIPMSVVRLYYLWKHRALVSGRAEVELGGTTEWGPGCVISAFTKVKITGRFVMGRRVQIATGCFIGAGKAGLTLGDDVLVGPNCTIVTGSYRFDRLGVPLAEQGREGKGVRIGHRAWIGANSVILDGSRIGDDVIVSAGSVVSGSVAPNSIVMGNPAKVIFTRR